MASRARYGRASRVEAAEDDVFVAGLDRIEHAGDGNARLVLYTLREDAEGILGPRQAPVSIVVPLTALPDWVGKSLAAIGRLVIVRPDGSVTVQQ